MHPLSPAVGLKTSQSLGHTHIPYSSALACRRLDQTAKTLLAQPKTSPNPAAGRRSVSFELDMTMLAGLPAPPEDFVCPLSQCLMTEPVTLINTGVTLQRSSAQKWFRTRECPHLLFLWQLLWVSQRWLTAQLTMLLTWALRCRAQPCFRRDTSLPVRLFCRCVASDFSHPQAHLGYSSM